MSTNVSELINRVRSVKAQLQELNGAILAQAKHYPLYTTQNHLLLHARQLVSSLLRQLDELEANLVAVKE